MARLLTDEEVLPFTQGLLDSKGALTRLRGILVRVTEEEDIARLLATPIADWHKLEARNKDVLATLVLALLCEVDLALRAAGLLPED